MENRTNGKQQLPFVCCKWQTEMANLGLFPADGKRKRKFVFLGWKTINGNRHLLFQRTCPSMYVYTFSSPSVILKQIIITLARRWNDLSKSGQHELTNLHENNTN